MLSNTLIGKRQAGRPNPGVSGGRCLLCPSFPNLLFGCQRSNVIITTLFTGLGCQTEARTPGNPWPLFTPTQKKRESRENRTKSRKEYFLSSVDFHFSSCAGCVSLCVFVAQFSRLHRLKPQSHKPISHGELEQGARGGAGCRRHCFRQSLVGKDSQPCMTLPLALLMRKMSKEIEKIQRTHKLTRYTG